MHDTYDLIGGTGAAKAILTQPLGAIGFVRYAGEPRTVFLRAHDDGGETSTGESYYDPSAYLAEYDDTYASIEELVADSKVVRDRTHGDILAWKLTPEDGLEELYRYDARLTGGQDHDAASGNNDALSAAITALPRGCGFLIGDYTSPFSNFTLGLRTAGGVLTSSCGPSICSEHFSDSLAGDMSDIPDDPHADAHAAAVLAVFGSGDAGVPGDQ